MTDRNRQTRIGTLFGAHLLLGLIMALIATGYPRVQNSMWASIWFMGLVSSDILLLGMWVGFASASWWVRLSGLLLGIAWLECLSLAPAPRMNATDYIFVLAIIAVPVLVVAGSCVLCRRWLARIERRSNWKSRRLSDELQFTLKSMICLTVTIAVILGLGRLQVVILPIVFGMTAFLGAGLLMWASLGPGQVIVRLPVMFVGMTFLGLLPPYYMGDGPSFRFFVWPALTVLVAICTSASLLVVRSCGYRLINIRSNIDATMTSTGEVSS